MEKKITFTNSKGQKLEGDLHLPSGQGPFPVIIMSNGLANRGKDAAERIAHADYFCQKGFIVGRYNYSGYGNSENEIAKLTVSQAIDDLQCVIKETCQNDLADPERLNLWGISLGSLISMFVAAENPQIQSLVLVSSAPSLFPDAVEAKQLEFFKLWKQQGWINLPHITRKIDYSFYQDAKQKNAFSIVNKINCPVLMIHGQQDQVVASLPLAEQFYSKLSGPKEFIVLPQGAHKYNEEDTIKIREASLTWFSQHND
ncbi:alpha/beta fold hydrolase [Patescibacteria group bacterium]|nr:alpha/beta fold hydrolase [Patescibacteria group bacterium]